MGVSNVPAASAAGLQPKYQKFTSSGTFTLPTGYGAAKPLLVNIQVIGGGGAGSPQKWSGDIAFRASRVSYFGEGYTGSTFNKGTFSFDADANLNGKGGGSGGLASTQMYLTSNLTITVGAQGARATASGGLLPSDYWPGLVNFDNSGNQTVAISGNQHTFTTNSGSGTGGSGGTTTAGSVSAAGGSGGSTNQFNVNVGYNGGNLNPTNGVNFNVNGINVSNRGGGSAGAGGTPSGTAGEATPLLGTMAGGSSDTSPIFGSFGIGGKRGDTATNTGVEGTGGGAGSVGAPGAVILTWWE